MLGPRWRESAPRPDARAMGDAEGRCEEGTLVDARGLEAAVRMLVRQTLESVEHDGSWRFRFTGGIHLSSRSAWRLLVGGRVTVGSEDDGLPLGLHEAVDAAADLTTALEGRSVVAAAVSGATGDLVLDFGDALELELLQLSSVRDAWSLDVPGDGELAPLVCVGGGQVARVPRPEEV